MSQLTQGKRKRLMYIENKEASNHQGDARIGWVTFSKTGLSIYYKGKLFQRTNGILGNYFETESGDEYWISGVKKSGSNRHWAGSGEVIIDDDARAEYEAVTGK